MIQRLLHLLVEHLIRPFDKQGESTDQPSCDTVKAGGEHQSDRYLAAGLEMPEGQWLLDKDGTLHFLRGQRLVGGAFGDDRGKVRRIVIDDFAYIAAGLFQRFPVLEELVITADRGTVCKQAFAHCHALRSVCIPEEWLVHPTAFEDTPYQASREGSTFEPTTHGLLERDPHGAAFLAELRQEIDRMHTQADGQARYGHWPFDSNTWFESCIDLLAEGYQAHEPTVSYLLAEFAQHCLPVGWNTDLLSNLQERIGKEDLFHLSDTPSLYLEAAELGSPHAQLWCAYCLDEGRLGFDRDPVRAQHVLAQYHAQDGPLDTLELHELDFAYDELLALVGEAHDADIEEDMVADQYRGSSDAPYPNPSWRTLHLRTIDLACFLLELGRTYQTKTCGYDYKWPGVFDGAGAHLSSLKAEWQAWCEEQGLLA